MYNVVVVMWNSDEARGGQTFGNSCWVCRGLEPGDGDCYIFWRDKKETPGTVYNTSAVVRIKSNVRWKGGNKNGKAKNKNQIKSFWS